MDSTSDSQESENPEPKLLKSDEIYSCIRFICFLLGVFRGALNLIRFHGVLAPNAKLRSQIIPSGKKSNVSDTADDAPHSPTAVRISWTRLLKLVFDIEYCPQCGGKMKIIAAILESGAIT